MNFIKSLRQRYGKFSKLTFVCCSEFYIDGETDYLASQVFMRFKSKTGYFVLILMIDTIEWATYHLKLGPYLSVSHDLTLRFKNANKEKKSRVRCQTRLRIKG